MLILKCNPDCRVTYLYQSVGVLYYAPPLSRTYLGYSYVLFSFVSFPPVSVCVVVCACDGLQLCGLHLRLIAALIYGS